MTVTTKGPILANANQQYVGNATPVAKTSGFVDNYFYTPDVQPSHAIAASPSRAELIAHLNKAGENSVLLAKTGADHVALATTQNLHRGHELWANSDITGAILHDQTLVSPSGTIEQLARQQRSAGRIVGGVMALALGTFGVGLYLDRLGDN